MTNPPPLNPPQTPECQEYNDMNFLYWQDIPEHRRVELLNNMQAHRATCPICQARIRAESDGKTEDAK